MHSLLLRGAIVAMALLAIAAGASADTLTLALNWKAEPQFGGFYAAKFDGDFTRLTEFETNERSYPFRLLAPNPNVAIIGSAGGYEILVSLYFGAAHVTGIELNPVTVDLLRHRFADYTGRIAYHPKVTLLNAEGRSFLESSPDLYDLVWFVAPDSYAAMNAATSAAKFVYR